jgi:hypothetical protein
MNVKRGLSRGYQQEGEGKKERIMKGQGIEVHYINIYMKTA